MEILEKQDDLDQWVHPVNVGCKAPPDRLEPRVPLVSKARGDHQAYLVVLANRDHEVRLDLQALQDLTDVQGRGAHKVPLDPPA